MGFDVRFTCNSSTPVIWYFNDGPLLTNVLTTSYGIYVESVVQPNQGTYKCKGLTEEGVQFIARGVLNVLRK